MKYFVGFDVSLGETTICIVDEAGGIFREGKAESGPEAIANWLKSIGVAIERLGLEAGPLSLWLCDELGIDNFQHAAFEPMECAMKIAASGLRTPS